MTTFYNEIDPFAAAWLRELIKAGVIARGVVDERDIRDIQPDELMGYTQCHFFAGIGVWSYALRCAGWTDARPVWTGSCPCQPFSAAGKRKGFADERHLWPAWFHLIQVCKPVRIFGEQVANKDGLVWLDIVQSDMEAIGYTVGAVDIPACGFGAPHKRNRLYFVADMHGERFNGESVRVLERGSRQNGNKIAGSGAVSSVGTPSLVNSFWADAEWLLCADEKARAVESLSEPLAYGIASDLGLVRLERRAEGEKQSEEVIVFAPLVSGGKNRVGRLKGYGNAIVALVATEFIKTYMEVRGI